MRKEAFTVERVPKRPQQYKRERTVLERVVLAGEGKPLKKYEKVAREVIGLEDIYKQLTAEELRDKTQEFRDRLSAGESPSKILPEAFATVREASARELGMEHYLVQIEGALALCDEGGRVAEMKTGEGKTLVVLMAAYMKALSGEGVHVVTANDYLAERDAEWMRPVYEALGLSVGTILPNRPPGEHKKAYLCDVTYGTANEFGFDYLKDQTAVSIDDQVQQGHPDVIIDEVDSILIDDARTPLILSEPAAEVGEQLQSRFLEVANKMIKGTEEGQDKGIHYEADEEHRTIKLTDDGVAFIEKELGIESLFEVQHGYYGYAQAALAAKEFFKKDKDYVVDGDEIVVVDEFTGRLLHGRRFDGGLHAAIEAKEQLSSKSENVVTATISLQNYFRLYREISGVTATAYNQAGEFYKTYKMPVVRIPTNEVGKREDYEDVIYKTRKEKFDGVVEEILERHAKEQPILVGTRSIEDSEYLSGLLREAGLSHRVLNAKNTAREAKIIAQAGRKGAVTIATNMAGRGVDIKLGGDPGPIAEQALILRGMSKMTHPAEYEEEVEKQKVITDAENKVVAGLGGLHILGTERHDSKRIDDQLRGRAGRQGEPGSSQFFVSLEDSLITSTKGPELVADSTPDGTPIHDKFIARQFRWRQMQVEQSNAEARKEVLKYDNVLKSQRDVIYGQRQELLASDNVTPYIEGVFLDVIDSYVGYATRRGYPDEWDYKNLWQAFGKIQPLSFSIATFKETLETDDPQAAREVLRQRITEDFFAAYDRRADEIERERGEGAMAKFEKQTALGIVDESWKDYLANIDYLQGNIRLRSLANPEPFRAYQQEALSMFLNLQQGIKFDTLVALFQSPQP